jgi:nucleotide-binding universal stress UspA family protein
MRILVAFDGSDDGFEGLRIAAHMMRAAGQRHEIALVIIGWPPRPSPIWERAMELRAVVDDLHRAMAEVAARDLARLRELFSPVGSIAPHYAEGDPVAEVVALIADFEPDLLIAGVTRGKGIDSVSAVTLATVAHTTVPMFVAFGPGSAR